MILRKPYGFLIKHFRFIHLIITGLLVYLAKFFTDIYSYINLCISNQVNRYNAFEYIDYKVYIYIGVTLILFGIIFWLFKYKDKPRNVYIFAIIGYLLIGGYLGIIYNYFGNISTNIIDQKVIRAYRDITLITLVFQYIFAIIMFLRGLGFDVKKFNFTKDIQELNLTSEDGEEVELDVNVNTDVLMRGIRKKKREFGYFFQEFRVIILGLFAILLFTIVYFGYNYFMEKFKVYNQGDIVGSVYNIGVNKSYFNIDDDKNYVIINFDILKYGNQEKFNLNNLKLSVDGVEYLPNKNICSGFTSLGICYKKQVVTSDKRKYIVTYQVDSLNLEKTYLVYMENYDDTYKIKLNLENYD